MDEQESYLNEEEVNQSLNNAGNKINQFGQGMYNGVRQGINDYKNIKNHGLQSADKDLNDNKKEPEIPEPKNQNTNPKCKGIGELTLLDFLEQAEGKNQNLADKQIALAGGGTLKFTILTSGGYGVQIQSQGVNVLLNTGAGWGYEMTPAELTKKDEFYSIYWKEYNAVKNGMNSELKELPDYLEKRPVFEAKA